MSIDDLLTVFLRDLHDCGAGAKSNRESYAYAYFKNSFLQIFIKLFTRRNLLLVFGKRPIDLRTVPKALTNKTAAYQLTKLNVLFMIISHTFYSLHVVKRLHLKLMQRTP